MPPQVARLHAFSGKRAGDETSKAGSSIPYRQPEYPKTRRDPGKHVKALASDDKCLEAIADGVVLHEHFVGLQHVLDVVNAGADACSEASPSRAFRFPQLEAIPRTPALAGQFPPWSSYPMPQHVPVMPRSFRRL